MFWANIALYYQLVWVRQRSRLIFLHHIDEHGATSKLKYLWAVMQLGPARGVLPPCYGALTYCSGEFVLYGDPGKQALKSMPSFGVFAVSFRCPGKTTLE